MPDLSGKVAIVTGAGRGIGREHALALARAGAKIVVNDLGASLAGEGADEGPAHDVVREIEALGGEAVANGENVADFAGAERMVEQAVDRFGRLDILVNNAGILRDRMLVNMDEHEWDAVHRRPPEGPLRADAPRRRALARALEGRRGRARARDQHVQPVGRVRQRRPGELRRGEGGHRRLHADRRAGARALRRHRQRARAERAHAHDRGGVRRDRRRPTTASTRPIPANNSPIVVALCADEAQDITGQVFFVYGGAVNMLRGWEAGELFSAGDVALGSRRAARRSCASACRTAPRRAGMLASMHAAGGQSMRER